MNHRNKPVLTQTPGKDLEQIYHVRTKYEHRHIGYISHLDTSFRLPADLKQTRLCAKRNKKKRSLPSIPSGTPGDSRVYYKHTYNINLFDYKIMTSVQSHNTVMHMEFSCHVSLRTTPPTYLDVLLLKTLHITSLMWVTISLRKTKKLLTILLYFYDRLLRLISNLLLVL